MKTLFIIIAWVLLSVVSFAQEYKDPFPDSRAPYRFRIYEREVLEAKGIDTIVMYHVVKKYNLVWRQGVYPFNGDTTNLIYIGQELELLSCDTNLYLSYPAYLRRDTIYVLPTIEGFNEWKLERGYK